MKFLLVWFLAGVLEVPFIRGEQPRWRAGHTYPSPLPQEIMVDAVNYIGLVLLQAHNQNNENNIALSPYGATSVLVALGEGVQGTALNEILRATLLPLDVSVTRVGLRDIHRHLKSYFIPQEGFLAGLTFSHENVTLKSPYEDILRFYGYDVDSFNNALYPDPYSTTTNIASESTTESLSSVSHTANFSSSTTQTIPITPSTVPLTSTLHTETVELTPTTLTVPSTVVNRDDFNSSESTTLQTTLVATDSIGSTTTYTTRITNAPTTTLGTSPITTVKNETQESTSTTSTVTNTPAQTTTTAAVTNTPTQTSTTITTIPVTTTTTATTSTTTQVTTTTTTIPSQSSVTIVTPSTIATTPQKPTSNTAGITTTTSGIVTTTLTTLIPDTTIQTTTTAAPTTTYISTVTTSQDSTSSPTTGSTFTTTPVTSPTTTTQTNSVTQSTRPTAVTISVVPSTVGNGDGGSTTSTRTTTNTPITQIDNTGPIVINLQPTTIASTSTTNTATESTATTAIPQTTTVTQGTRPTAVTVSVVPNTVGSDDEGKTTLNSTTTTPITLIDNTRATVINLQRTTTNTATESTAVTESISTITTVPSTVPISTDNTNIIENVPSTNIATSTTNPETTTLNSDSESTAFSIDLAPSTIGTGSTPIGSTTTGNPIPTLITPVGDLPDGFEIDVRPTTIGQTSADIIMAENEKTKRMVTNKTPKRNSRPRFRDDLELVKSFQFDNASAAVHKVVARSFIPQSTTSGNAVGDKKTIEVKGNALVKNMKDIIIDASIGKTSADPTTISTTDAGNYDRKLDSKSENTTSTNEADKEYYDEDIIIVNREADIADREIEAKIISSQEGMLAESSFDKEGFSTEDDDVGDEKARGTRSVIDYLIARYHDNNPSSSYMSNIGSGSGSNNEYEPLKPTTFAVNGKIRESNINFMTYDTVLPFRYISYLNALALTFPLDSNKYYLLLILPLDEMGIDNLIANMMSTTLKQIIYHLQPTRVKATIPSFMLKGYVVLTPTLQKLGIKQIFEPRHADFSRMTDDKDIYVTNIEQAVTVTIRNYVDPSTLKNNQHFRRRGPVQFTADHPFLYFVMDSQIHVALMAGKIINPLNSRIR